MLNHKICVTMLFVPSILATAQDEIVVELTRDEKGHIAARKLRTNKPAISTLSNGSLDIPVEGIQN